MGGERHAQAALPPVKARYPLYRRLGGPQGAGVDGCPDRPARSDALYRLSYPGPRSVIVYSRLRGKQIRSFGRNYIVWLFSSGVAAQI